MLSAKRGSEGQRQHRCRRQGGRSKNGHGNVAKWPRTCGHKKSSHRWGRNLWKPWSRDLLAPMVFIIPETVRNAKIFREKKREFRQKKVGVRRARGITRIRVLKALAAAGAGCQGDSQRGPLSRRGAVGAGARSPSGGHDEASFDSHLALSADSARPRSAVGRTTGAIRLTSCFVS